MFICRFFEPDHEERSMYHRNTEDCFYLMEEEHLGWSIECHPSTTRSGWDKDWEWRQSKAREFGAELTQLVEKFADEL